MQIYVVGTFLTFKNAYPEVQIEEIFWLKDLKSIEGLEKLEISINNNERAKAKSSKNHDTWTSKSREVVNTLPQENF